MKNEKYVIRCLQCGSLLHSKGKQTITCDCPNKAFVKMSNDKMSYGANHPLYVQYLKDYED